MKYKLIDLLDFKTQGVNTTTDNISYVDKGYKIVQAKNIAPYNITFDDSNYIDEETFNRIKDNHKLHKGEVLYTNIGSQLGNSAIYESDDEAIITWNVMKLIPNKEIIDNYYLCYLLNSNKSYIKALNTSSTMPFVSGKELMNVEFDVPDLITQKKIVKILKDIGDKIKINNEINNNLLQLCRYKYDDLNKDYDSWNLTKINDLNLEVTDYVANGSFKSLADNVTLYDEKEYALYVRNTDLKVNFADKRKYVDQKSYEFLKKSKLTGGELIISNVGDVGSVFICPHLDMPMTLGSNVIMLYSTDSHYYNYFLYFFFTSVYGQYMIKGITGGSAQPKFNKTDFRNMEIKFPSLEKLDRFNNEIDSVYKKYELNIRENEKLSELRDTLLLKLMNGEIDLDNIEI